MSGALLVRKIAATSRSRTIFHQTNLLFPARRPLYVSSPSNTIIMKYQPASLTALLAASGPSTSAWMSLTTESHRHQFRQLTSPLSSRTYRPIDSLRNRRGIAVFFSSSLQSAVTADDILETQQNERYPQVRAVGKAIAKGNIVSSFRGGLVAVRVDGDLMIEDPSPQLIDTTQSLPKAKTSSNTLGRFTYLRNAILEFRLRFSHLYCPTSSHLRWRFGWSPSPI
jgi:hypothetical protein